MAKTAVIMRENRRIKTYQKYKTRRDALREHIRNIYKDPNADYEALQEAYAKLQSMPRNASRSRIRNRCSETGRSRGNYRRFGLCRIKLREYAMNGEIPGVVKSSW